MFEESAVCLLLDVGCRIIPVVVIVELELFALVFFIEMYIPFSVASTTASKRLLVSCLPYLILSPHTVHYMATDANACRSLIP